MTASRPILPRLLALAAAVIFAAVPLSAAEEEIHIECDDGFVLDGRVRLPDDADGPPAKVIVLLHGSGPQSMDADLTAVTRDGKKNLLFVELSEALADAGFGVVRYHKRSHQMRIRAAADPAFAQSDIVQHTTANPLKWFVDDAKACVRFVQERYPEAGVYLLGHSQGASIALRVIHEMEDVQGVALVAFALGSTDLLVFEQTVYRPLGLFRKLDTDGDGRLVTDEMPVTDPIGASLRAQMGVIDLDGDGALDQMEMQAGNLSNLLIRDIAAPVRVEEANAPRPADILRDTDVKVAFFQGLLDNQTPAYNAKAVELVAKHLWRKTNFRFTYFPGLGHALDARDDYDDLKYDTIDPEAKARLVGELAEFF